MRMECRFAKRIRFVGEQDGEPEMEIKAQGPGKFKNRSHAEYYRPKLLSKYRTL